MRLRVVRWSGDVQNSLGTAPHPRGLPQAGRHRPGGVTTITPSGRDLPAESDRIVPRQGGRRRPTNRARTWTMTAGRSDGAGG